MDDRSREQKLVGGQLVDGRDWGSSFRYTARLEDAVLPLC